MGKKTKSRPAEGAPETAAPTTAASTTTGGFPLAATKVDPGLAALFAQSAGPVKEPELKPAYRKEGKYNEDEDEEVEDDDEVGEDDEDEDEGDENEDGEDDKEEDDGDEDEDEDEDAEMEDVEEEKKSRKRKRGAENEDLETAYLQRLTREDDLERKREAKDKPKRVKTTAEDEAEEDEEEEDEKIPMHESLANKQSDPLDKASRTLFLSNVSTEAIKSKSAKKTLLAHLSSLLPKPSSTAESANTSTATVHKIESLRFRSTAFSSTALPRRAAYAKKELMDSTTKGTNAYVVYSTVLAAKKALKLNGTMVLDRHIRVDSVSKPAPVDHTRCVFVGNLGFVDEETQQGEEGEVKKKKKKSSVAGDVEEGLWRTFNAECGGEGSVESVRVVRDRLTRVGKGFAYVQFRDGNGVEAALLCDGKKFPPLLPRRLRVTRAKKVVVGSEGVREGVKGQLGGKGGKVRREEKLFGQAVAAGMRDEEKKSKRRAWDAGRGSDANSVPLGAGGKNKKKTVVDTSTRMVFEGYRAKDGAKPAFKMKGKKKGGKPKTRSTRRANAYRAAKK